MGVPAITSTTVSSIRRAVFDRYALPRPRRRGGSAAALSVVVHAAVALLVLWRGALWFENSAGGGVRRGGGQGGDRPAISWVALPQFIPTQAETPSRTPPGVSVPTVVPPRIEPVKLDVPTRIVATRLPTPLPTPSTATDDNGPDAGDGREAGGGLRADSTTGAGSGGGAGDIFAGDIFGPTPVLVATPPAGAPPEDNRRHDVQFWVRTDGRVTKIAVSPPIRDSGYRRRFMEAMSDIAFGPVKTRDGRPIEYVYSIVVNP